jgi:hypothetical protein
MQRHVLISHTTSALFVGNFCFGNTRFALPQIVLIIILGEILRDMVTFFLLDGSLHACVILTCRGITEECCSSAQ